MADINLAGSIGIPGNTSILGHLDIVLVDANYTMSAAEFSNKFLILTSSVPLTAMRNIIGPLNKGQEYIIINRTSGGQDVQIIGSSGTGIIVQNGAALSVVCDGSNYNPSAGTASGAVGITFQPGGTLSKPGVYTNEASLKTVCAAFGDSTYTLYIDLTIVGAYTMTSTSFAIGRNCTITDGGLGGSLLAGACIFDRWPTCIKGSITIEQSTNTTNFPGDATSSPLCVIKENASVVSAGFSNPMFDASTSPLAYVEVHDNGVIGLVSAGHAPIFSDGGAGTLQINAFDNATLGSVLAASGNIRVNSPNVSLDTTLFSLVIIFQIWLDPTGTAVSTMLPSNSDRAILISNGILYQSNGVNWVAITSGTAGGINLVFSPSGTVAPGVYTTESSLAAATQLFNGAQYSVFFDLSHVSGSYNFTTIGPLALAQNGIWTDNGLNYQLVFSSGAQLTNPPIVIEGRLSVSIQQSTVITLTANQLTVIRDGASLSAQTGSGGFVNSNGFVWNVDLYGVAVYGGGGVPPGIGVHSGDIQLRVYDGATLNFDTGSLTYVTVSTYSSGSKIASGFYPNLFIAGIFTDYTNTGTSTIPASQVINGSGYLLQNGTLHYSNGAAWS